MASVVLHLAPTCDTTRALTVFSAPDHTGLHMHPNGKAIY